MNKSILVYSPFGIGKTSFLGLLVRALLEKFPAGASARLYSAEHWNSISDLVSEGLVVPWKVNSWDHPFETTHRACDGAWPAAVGEDGNYDQKAGVVMPVREDFLTKHPIRIHEGMATFANYIAGNSALGGMADRIGNGEQIGPTDSGELVRVEDGSVSVGGLSRSNYGFVQKEMTSLVQRSQRKPGISIWTTHEDDVKEKKGGVATGQTIIGPEVIGGALTQVIGREFSDVWRLVAVPIDYAQADGSTRRVIERRLYVKEHIDPSSGMVAKARNSGGLARQKDIPDFFSLTEKVGGVSNGQPRMDAAVALVRSLGL